MSLDGNAIIAQSGGPTAVINSSVCGVVQEWMRSGNSLGRIFAGVGGIKGVLEGRLIDLSCQSRDVIDGLRYTPGAGLHSCRYKMKEIDQARLIEICRKLNVRYFFYNGGNDSMDTAKKTFDAACAAGYEMAVVGVPKTVDNDLAFTDHCPGYGSAAKYIAVTVRETGMDLESVSTSNKVTVLETMGRNAGWLTAAAALARNNIDDAPHLIYLPEVPFVKENALRDIEEVYRRLGYVYVVVSEGIADAKGEYFSSSANSDAFGHKQLSGAGEAVKSLIEIELGIKARCNTLGTAQRSAAHYASLCDNNEAYKVGVEAVQYALRGETGCMVAIKRISDNPYQSGFCPIPLAEVANVEYRLPPDWINEAHNNVNDNFIRYAAPLIEGEVSIPMKQGLPDYVRLDFSKGVVSL